MEKIQLVEAGRVLVSVSLPERITPKVDATAKIVPVGFVGDAVVEFDRATPRPARQSKIIIGSQASDWPSGSVLSDRQTASSSAPRRSSPEDPDQLRSTLTPGGHLKAAQRTMAIYATPARRRRAHQEMTAFRQLTPGSTPRWPIRR